MSGLGRRSSTAIKLYRKVRYRVQDASLEPCVPADDFLLMYTWTSFAGKRTEHSDWWFMLKRFVYVSFVWFCVNGNWKRLRSITTRQEWSVSCELKQIADTYACVYMLYMCVHDTLHLNLQRITYVLAQKIAQLLKRWIDVISICYPRNLYLQSTCD